MYQGSAGFGAGFPAILFLSPAPWEIDSARPKNRTFRTMDNYGQFSSGKSSIVADIFIAQSVSSPVNHSRSGKDP